MNQAFVASIVADGGEEKRGVLSIAYRSLAIDCRFVSQTERVNCTAACGSVRFFDSNGEECPLPEPADTQSRNLGLVAQLQLLGEQGNLLCRFYVRGRLPATADAMRVTHARVLVNPRAR